MLTDDPGTPGDGHWEINIATLSEHSGDTSTYALPLLDINYGVGDRLQLKFEMPWDRRARRRPRPSIRRRQQPGRRQMALLRCRRRRLADVDVSAGADRASRCPDRRSPTAAWPTCCRSRFSASSATGASTSTSVAGCGRAGQGDTWIGGVAIGRELSKNLEVIGELHDEADVHSSRNELTLNFGARWQLSEAVHAARFRRHATCTTASRNKSSLLTYVGLQVNL